MEDQGGKKVRTISIFYKLKIISIIVLACNLGTFCQARNASLTICRRRPLEKGWGVGGGAHSHHVSVGGAVLAPWGMRGNGPASRAINLEPLYATT